MLAVFSRAGLLRDPKFDAALLGATTLVAIAAGAVSATWAWALPILVLADLWLLGYHHVISTFTRLTFSKADIAAHKFSLFVLPFLVLAGVLAVAVGFGIWAIVSIYFYWQWFHYARQSWGVSKAYQRKAPEGARFDPEWLAQAQLWLLPIWGVLARSQQDSATFLGMPIEFVPVDRWLVDIVGMLAIASLALWAVRRLQDWRAGRLAPAHTFYMASHHLIFFIAYIAIPDLTAGWLVANIWHNAQYILFVYGFNANRFRSGADQNAPLLSRLAQPGNAWRYMAVCFALSTIVYLALGQLAALVVAPVLIWQTINFHHYIVDSFLWRKPQVQRSLAAAPA
jgi:hypothetical protein